MALLKALLVALAIGVTVTAVIVVGDYAYTKAKEIAESLRKQKAHEYYRAIVYGSNGGEVLIGDPLDRATCISWVAAKNDCFAVSESLAESMARTVHTVKPRGPEIHGSYGTGKYLPHYHPKYAQPGESHCFFLY